MSLVGGTRSKGTAVKTLNQPIDRRVDLNVIHTTVVHGCMGLPRELVDHIMEMLHDHHRTLQACSLTCKAMFASTRHLIHQTLYLTRQAGRRVVTQGGKSRYQGPSYRGLELRFLDYMGECGLLQLIRQVHISTPVGYFTPDDLLPNIYLHLFRSLGRVSTLSIDLYHAVAWSNRYKTCFDHFHPTLTSLTLSQPFGPYRLVLRFALQFPNLQNLCLERLAGRTQQDLTVAAFTKSRSPPLNGHLRLAGALGMGVDVDWPLNLVRELPNGMNFRSIELEAFPGYKIQRMLNACASTLEDLTIITPYGNGTSMHQLSFLC